MNPVTIGLIGCGTISEAYLKGAARSRLITVKSVADLDAAAAARRAAEFGVVATTVESLIDDPDIEIVLNLTVPLAHAKVGLAAIAAGKHVYSEKPLAATYAEARQLADAADAAGVRLGCAPDTFLGGAHQACRGLIDAGRIGRVLGGAAAVISRGMESWHPNPDFFFKPGGGPVLDLGPYYVTDLVQLIGAVRRVTAIATRGFETRLITSQPRAGQSIAVEIPTTVNGVLEFANGANVSLTLSWDVHANTRIPIELYGTDGSLQVPDPNFFGGTPLVRTAGTWDEVDIDAHPFSAPNRTTNDGRAVADYRIVGILDMAAALRRQRPHRADGGLALHALEVMEAMGRSSYEGRHIDIETSCERPAPVPLGGGEEVFLS